MQIQKEIQDPVEGFERQGGRRRPECTLIQACQKPRAECSLEELQVVQEWDTSICNERSFPISAKNL